MKVKRRRTIPPHKAMAAIVGGLGSPLPPPMPSRCCGRCGEKKVTVKNGLCLSCHVKAKAEARALPVDGEGPF